MRHRPFLLHFLVLIHLRELSSLVRRDTCIDDLLDVSVHDLIQFVQGKIDSVIRHTSLREVVGTDLLGTVTGTDLAAAHLSLRIVTLLLLDIVELLPLKEQTPLPYSGSVTSPSGCTRRYRTGSGSDAPRNRSC